jgi:hypothetical protein
MTVTMVGPEPVNALDSDAMAKRSSMSESTIRRISRALVASRKPLGWPASEFAEADPVPFGVPLLQILRDYSLGVDTNPDYSLILICTA